MACPYCDVARDRCFYTGELVVGFWHENGAGGSDPMALVVTRRHVASWFDASMPEQAELARALAVARMELARIHAFPGFRISIDIGVAAGQAVPHLAVQLRPYRARDGLSGVDADSPNDARLAGVRSQTSADVPHARALVRGGEDDPLLPHLLACLDGARNVDIAVAFTMESGVRALDEHLRDVLDGGGRVRIVTGDYLGITEPRALLRLLDLQGDLQLRAFESGGLSFHPKAYIVTDRAGAGTAFVGSSNLSETALRGGVEWNYRVITSRDRAGFGDVVDAFDRLFSDPRCARVDAAWVRRYEARRTPPLPDRTGIAVEPLLPPPEPHPIQRQALAALEATRAEGNSAGLVVLATGLGKTWLSAFDSQRPEYPRVLFVAHREEILAQAMNTFRRIRPAATLGYYTGREKTADADVLFASIQTLARSEHLQRFGRRQFDYVIVDEFHHAAASSYRKLINYLEPKFLLGLTATPERTDGGDLLSLCGDNLVYRCDVAEGIRQGLLSPFAYFGVPDDVDYENIPWRSNRFDETELTNALATEKRAGNALEQLQRHGGRRALAFCASQRHADFMARFFNGAGLRAAAVHAGADSAPRARSLERLEAGDLDVVCAVDMFNEGVDLPRVDTVLMLRPTESRIVWLQQFGRGLRYVPDKQLKVIDYIGNHRVFLTKTRALLNLGDSNRDVAYALDQLEKGTLELPPGCAVTYDLDVVRILRALVQPAQVHQLLETFYREFRERLGRRPLALELFNEGLDPKSVRKHHGSWLDFVRNMGDFDAQQEQVWNGLRDFLRELEVMPLVRADRMLVFLALVGMDAFPGHAGLAAVAERVAELAKRWAVVRNEIGNAVNDRTALRTLLNGAVAELTRDGRAGGAWFTSDGESLASSPDLDVPPHLRETIQDLVGEIADWRIAQYVRRTSASTADRIICSVSHSAGRPILLLPSRERHEGIPEGWRDVVIEDKPHQANFARIAIGAVTAPESEENILPALLQKWFGPDAGKPGRTDRVLFRRAGNEYVMSPMGDDEGGRRPELWQRYARRELPALLGFEFQSGENRDGVIYREDLIILFVNLEKADAPDTQRYADYFVSPTEFHWQSQSTTSRRHKRGRPLGESREKGIKVHLFVRRWKKISKNTQPFIYCGPVEFLRWEGDKPINVWWQLREPVPENLWVELQIRSLDPPPT